MAKYPVAENGFQNPRAMENKFDGVGSPEAVAPILQLEFESGGLEKAEADDYGEDSEPGQGLSGQRNGRFGPGSPQVASFTIPWCL